MQIQVILSWLTNPWQADGQIAEVIQALKCLVCVISMRLLNPARSIQFLDNEVHFALVDNEFTYIASAEILAEVNAVVCDAFEANLVSASPVIFSWALILRQMSLARQERTEKRDYLQNRQAQEGFERETQEGDSHPTGRRLSASSIVSLETQSYDQFLVEAFEHHQQDLQVAAQLADGVTSGGQVYDLLAEMALCMGQAQNASFRPSIGSRMRLVLLEFLKVSFPVAGYISESVSTLLAVLSGGQNYWDLSTNPLLPSSQDVVATALADHDLLGLYVGQALNRYPHEFLPFVSLCKILSSYIGTDERLEVVLRGLLKTPTLTFDLPPDFMDDYELVDEVENENKMRITRNLPLIAALSTFKRRVPDDHPFYIPDGTLGRFVSDEAQVVQFDYEHSTLALLGKRLEANLVPASYSTQLGPLSLEEAAETVSFMATLIRSETLKASLVDKSIEEAGLAILNEASSRLRSKDLVTVVCDTLDSQSRGDLANFEDSQIGVMTACLEFLDSVLLICPGRVWSYMTRCDLLTSDLRAGRLLRITGNQELVDDRFHLLTSAIKLFSNMVDSATKSAVQRNVGSKPNGRISPTESLWIGTSDKILSQVNSSIAQTIVDVLENSLTWKFASEVHRSVLVGDVIPIMDKFVKYSFSMGGSQSLDPLTATLQPAAHYIADSFLSSSSSSLRFQPILRSLLVAFGMPHSTLYLRRTEIISRQLIAVVDFATSLVRAADFLDKPTDTFGTQLLQASPLLARLCAVSDSYKGPILSLLGVLAASLGGGKDEPPSLLGYLGPPISRSFLRTISKLDKPFDRASESKKYWRFFSSIIRNGQQWMSNCLLRGKTSREASGSNSSVSKLSSDSVLRIALQKLRSIRTMSSSETLAILDFLTSAQNFWQWTIFASQEDSGCLAELRAFVHELRPASLTVKVDPGKACDEARIAAYIAEAFAMQLYHLRQVGRGVEFAHELINDIDYYLRDGVSVSGYNNSLHANFTRNFSSQYPGFSLDDFKRTLMAPRELGKHYYYALDYAEDMLSFDPGWAGRRGDGFRNEMEMANLNLSLVDAQVALFHAWEFLLLELSTCLLPKEQMFTKQMMQVAISCLLSNQQNQGPEQIFMRITQSRADLAMVLVQRLTDISLLPTDIAELLTAIWTTISSIENPFGLEQIEYYRTMIRILYVVLRGYHTSPSNVKGIDSDRVVAVTQCVLNILDRVVAAGFRTLVVFIHDSEATAVPEDVALLTALLQACLCMPGIDQCQLQILNIMVSQDILRVATALFSWSDRLADQGDPIYGELSILFLLELSSVPLIAERLACDGLLGQITSANIAGHIQRPNVTPFADSAGAQRCYVIWAKGILPLLLNIITALGSTIAPEVAYVLMEFPNLLKSSVERFEAPGGSRTAGRSSTHYVTLIAAAEINSLALLTRVLGAFRVNNNRDIPEIPWDAATLLENVDFWLASPHLLRERLLPLGQREAEWRNTRAGTGEANKLEEKVIAQLEAVREVLSEDLE